MTSVGGISVGVTSDTSAFQRAMVACVAKLNSVGDAAKGAVAGADRFGRALAAAKEKADGFNDAKGFATSVMSSAAVATAALGGLTAVSVKAASDFAESTNVVQQAFGSLSPTIETWAAQTAKAMGRSTGAVRDYAGSLQAMIGPMVGSNAQAARMSTEFAKLAIDLGSFWNMADDDVLVNLRSGLAGESEPMRKFGVDISEAALNTLAFSMGLKTQVSQMDTASKVQLRYLQIMKQTAIAQGDAVRTASGFANSTKALEGAFDDLKVALGEGFLDDAATLTQALTGWVRGFNALAPATRASIGKLVAYGAVVAGLVTVLAGLAAAVLGALAAFSMITPAVAAAATAFGIGLAGALGTAGAAAGAFTAAYWLTSKALDAVGLGLPKSVSLWESLSGSVDDATSSMEGFKVAAIDVGVTLIDSAGSPLKLLGRSWDDTMARMHQSLTDLARGKNTELGTAALEDAMREHLKTGQSVARALEDQTGQSSELVDMMSLAGDEAMSLANEAKIGAEIEVTGAMNASDAEKKRAAAIDQARKALEAFNDVQRRAANDALKAALPQANRGIADIFARLNDDVLEARTKGAAAGRNPAAAIADLTAGALGNLRDELEGMTFREFVAGIGFATQQLEKLGQSGPQIEAFLASLRPPERPGQRELFAENALTADAPTAIPELVENARAAADRIGALAVELGHAGATSEELAALQKMQGNAAAALVRDFNAAGLSVDEYNQALPTAIELLEALGDASGEAARALKANPSTLGDLLSGGVGGKVDELVSSFDVSVTPAQRGEIVDGISGALEEAITTGGIDGVAIGRAIGGLLGGTENGANALRSMGVSAGADSVAAGAAIGAAVVPVVGVISQVLTAISDAIKAAAQGISDAVTSIVEFAGDARLTEATRTMTAPFVTFAVQLLILGALAFALGGALAILFGAVVLVLGVFGALAAAFQLSLSTKSFERFQSAIAGVVDRIVGALEPFWDGLLALAGLFDSFVSVILPLFSAFAGVGTAGRVLFEVFKWGAVIVGGFMIALGAVDAAMKWMAKGLVDAITWIMQGVADILAPFGIVADGLSDVIAGLRSTSLAIQAMSPNLEDMGAALVDLTGLTYEEAQVRAIDLADRKEAAAEASNIPSGYKIAAERFRAITAQDLRGGVLGVDSGAYSSQATTTTINIQSLMLEASNLEQLIEQLQRIGERRSLQTLGTTGTRDAQNNGR